MRTATRCPPRVAAHPLPPPMLCRRFKDISQAFKVLSDPDERAHYDRYGDEPARPRPRQHNQQGVYAEELTPEDIFNMFFGGGPGMGGVHSRGGMHGMGGMHGRHRQRQQPVQAQGSLLQLLPVAMIVIFSALSSLSLSDSPEFSLRPTAEFATERCAINPDHPPAHPPDHHPDHHPRPPSPTTTPTTIPDHHPSPPLRPPPCRLLALYARRLSRTHAQLSHTLAYAGARCSGECATMWATSSTSCTETETLSKRPRWRLRERTCDGWASAARSRGRRSSACMKQ